MKDLISISVHQTPEKDYKIGLLVKQKIDMGTMSIEEIEEMLDYMPENMDDLHHMLFDYYESKIVKENLDV